MRTREPGCWRQMMKPGAFIMLGLVQLGIVSIEGVGGGLAWILAACFAAPLALADPPVAPAEAMRRREAPTVLRGGSAALFGLQAATIVASLASWAQPWGTAIGCPVSGALAGYSAGGVYLALRMTRPAKGAIEMSSSRDADRRCEDGFGAPEPRG